MNRPHWALALAEAPRVAMEAASLMLGAPWLTQLPKGDGHAVMIIPGFLGGDQLNRSLLSCLK